jgi:hypothetical protein
VLRRIKKRQPGGDCLFGKEGREGFSPSPSVMVIKKYEENMNAQSALFNKMH